MVTKNKEDFKGISFILLSCIFIFLFSISLVSAVHNITNTSGGTSLILVEDVSTRINITVNNTDAEQNANITVVNITIPVSFTFDDNTTNGTSLSASNYTFTINNRTTSWSNTTTYLINGSEAKNFWINATAPTPGTYNITVTTVNITSSYSSNISVTVTDITAPSAISFQNQTPSTGVNLSQNYITVNISSTDNVGISTIRLYLYNSTGLVNNTNSTSNPALINFTNLADGVYYVNATANDTSNNVNTSSGTLTITLDTTNSLIQFVASTESNNSNVSRNWIFVNVTLTETNFKNITFVLYNNSSLVNSTNYTVNSASNRTINWTGLGDRTYYYNVTVYDLANNTNITETRQITLDTVSPSLSYSCTPSIALPGETVTCTCSGTDSTSGVNSSNLSYTSNPSTAGAGTFTLTCTGSDYSGNGASIETSYSVEQSSTGGSSAGGGGSTSGIWKNTYLADDAEFSVKGLITRDLAAKSRIKLKINAKTHFVGVITLGLSNAVIEVTSTPQQATLKVGENKKFDVDDNGYYDLIVKLNSILTNKASISIESINEKIPEVPLLAGTPEEKPVQEAPQGNVVPEQVKADSSLNQNKNTWIIGIIIVLALITVIVYYLIARKRR